MITPPIDRFVRVADNLREFPQPLVLREPSGFSERAIYFNSVIMPGTLHF